MGRYIFTGKFKVGDEVECIKGNAYFPEAYIQPGDFGIVIKIDNDHYEVHKKNAPKNECCYMHECEIDFADVSKREVKVTRVIKERSAGGGVFP